MSPRDDQISLELVRLGCDIVPDAHFVTAGFICNKFVGEPRAMEPEEIVKWDWFNYNELPQNMYLASLKVIDAWKDKDIWDK